MALVCGLVAPLSVHGQRSRHCGRGSSHLLFCLMRSLAAYGPLACHSVRSGGFGVDGGGFLTASGPSETTMA